MNSHNIAMALRAAYLSMHRLTNLYLSKYGITADQFVCLVILASNSGITQQELAKLATSDANTIRAMLLLLEKQGLVIRKNHPKDGRAFSVSLTKKGFDVHNKLLNELQPVRDKMISLFSQKENYELVNALNRITNELNK